MTKSEHKDAVQKFMKSRGSIMGEKGISQNSFILGNKFNDVWFQELDLVEVFQKDIQYYYKFYEGPRVLPNIDHLLCAQSGENDLNLVVYMKDMKNLEQLQVTKEFRKMSQANQNEVFHYLYWIVNDEEMAKQMGIDPEDVGDIHLLRKSTAFTKGIRSDVRLGGYGFSSEKIATKEELLKSSDRCRDRILNYAFNSPVLVKDYRQFFSLANMFKAVIFVVYCDPKDKKNRKKVLDSMVEARKRLPINL